RRRRRSRTPPWPISRRASRWIPTTTRPTSTRCGSSVASALAARLYWPGWVAATALTGIVAGFMLGHALILARFVDWLLMTGTPAPGLEYAAFRATAGRGGLTAFYAVCGLQVIAVVVFLGLALASEEERMVRDAVRDWVETEFLPVVTAHHRAGTFPLELIPKLGELGVFGATLKGYGCAGLNHVAYGLIMQELERGDSGLRSAASVQSGLVMYPIYAYGSEAQKEAWLPLLATGARVGCFGLTEPDHGSDPGGMKTRARREGGADVLSGTQVW